MAESFSIPIELIEQYVRGNVLLFVGEGINLADPGKPRPPSSSELAAELATQANYPAKEKITLPRVAGYFEMVMGRHALIQVLRDRLLAPEYRPSCIHNLIKQLSIRTVITFKRERQQFRFSEPPRNHLGTTPE